MEQWNGAQRQFLTIIWGGTLAKHRNYTLYHQRYELSRDIVWIYKGQLNNIRTQVIHQIYGNLYYYKTVIYRK